MAPGESTGFVDQGPSSRGERRVELIIEDEEGGACAVDPYARFTWSGTLKENVSVRKRR